MITERQINLVKASWALVAHTDAQASALLYSRLAELDHRLVPTLRDEVEKDSDRIVRLIDSAVYGLRVENTRREPIAIPTGRQPAYLDYAYYDTFGAALFWTLARRMGDGFSDEMFKAWSSLYMRLFAAMQTIESKADLPAAA